MNATSTNPTKRPLATAPRARLSLLILLLLLAPLCAHTILADPTGANIVSNVTETVAPASAGSSTTAGGSFTTLVLNATTQSPRWKAYVGNVTGTFALRDAENKTLYDWGVASASGEVFATRFDVSWTGITCAANATLTAEQAALNMSSTSVDTINKTFDQKVHREFYVGTTRVANSTCWSIATYVNSAAQAATENADFQEVLLENGAGELIFAALIKQGTIGFDNERYDFQMIVPEDEYAATPHTYYFWLELS